MSDGAGRGFWGALLVAVGALIAVLSGLCSLSFAAGMLRTAFTGPHGPHGADAFGGLVMGGVLVGVVGGLPFGCGVVLIIAGRALMRPTSGPPPPPE